MPQNNNNGDMRKNTNNQQQQQNQQPPEAMNRLKQKQQRRGLGKSKSQKVAKSSKNSRDGYYKYSMSIRYNSGDTIANLNGLDDEEDEGEGGGDREEDGDNDDDLLPPIQVSFDILFDNNDKGGSSSLVEDGDAIKGHGSESEEDAFSSFTDRPGRGQDDDNEEEEGSDSTLATTTTTADQEVSTTSTETINGEFPTTTTTNSTNIEVSNKWEINPIGRTSAIAAAGLISLVSFGSVLFVSVGVYIHAKRSKTAATAAAAAAAALAGGAAANNNENNVEDGSVDASSIWSANEGGDVAGGGGGQPMSPQPAGVSSIAAIGMASPLALQLSGRTFD